MHFRDPEATTPNTVMPSYAHLERTRLNFGQIPDRVQAAAWLGAPYDVELDDAEAIARFQAQRIVQELVAQGGPDHVQLEPGPGGPAQTLPLEETQVVALIAYLQRVGTDLDAPPANPHADMAPAAEVTPAAGSTLGGAR